MKPYLVIATINELANLEVLKRELLATGTKIPFVDEGDSNIRSRDDKILRVPKAYYCPRPMPVIGRHEEGQTCLRTKTMDAFLASRLKRCAYGSEPRLL